MQYRILGPLEALGGDGPLSLGGTKQRALLAMLLLHANRVVSRRTLIEGLWGNDPPERAEKTVQVYVSRLRKVLLPEALVTRSPGYLVEIAPEDFDLARFERLLDEARGADPENASLVLREALALWRGEALAEFAGEPFAHIEAGRLDDLRLAALEERIQADLTLGRHAGLIGELEVLIDAHPERERLREQLMLALYRSGRQSEALAEYRRVRELLDELGLEPSLNLQRLQRQILNHDVELDAPAPVRPAAREATAEAEPPAPAAAAKRRRVTVLFAAVASTNEAEDDPERIAAFFERLHVEAAAEIEAAGGTVERGLAGALLATFGQSSTGGDDHASRALAAAVATCNRLTDAFGDSISLRMGLESGDAIVGGSGTIAVGAPVTAAARLVRLAQPGEVVVGEHAAAATADAFNLRKRDSAYVLATGTRSADVRKIVTVLFADLVESTRLVNELDAEALRRVMSLYIEAMQAAVERHGGIIEKFIGDAVMAVFGVPVVHEDDALRAVRAAAEMRDALAQLDRDVQRAWGVRLSGRIGISSGEVVAGDHLRGHLIVTGSVVNVAKRLEEAATANEILLSEATHRLVTDAVVARRVPGRLVKGGETVEPLQLVEVRTHVPGRIRRFDSPMVDRENERAALEGTFANVVQNEFCHLLTVLGDAGVGKSRLVHEFTCGLDGRATVLHGQCLPYGEGITYWPLAEVVRELIRVEGPADAEPSSATIAALLPGEEKAAHIGGLIAETLGLGDAGAGIGEETFWAVRKLFESIARRRPLVVVFDDIQWAEPTFVELVDYLAEHARDAPILLLCLARPEVFDSHPHWGGGKLNAGSMKLEPLNDDDCRRLIANRAHQGSLPERVERRIAEAADGNALFAEELLAMLVDRKLLVWDDERWVVADDLADLSIPDTINSLIAARLEGLPEEERSLLVRASVEGTLFHLGALRELGPDLSDSALRVTLSALVRRDVIRPDRSSFAGEDAYRFRHVLIRDAAYRSLAKETRADFHERFAAWLEETAGERAREYEEIVAYHLEQAYRYRLEMGAAPEELRTLGARASQRLESAGLRALARSDLPAAIGLLERAASLATDEQAREAALLLELGGALMGAGRLAEAGRTLADATVAAREAHDESAEAHVLVQRQFLEVLHATEDGTEAAAQTVKRVVPIFERHHDHRGLCSAHRLEAWLHWNEAHAAAAAEAWEQAAAEAALAGDEHARADILTWIASSLSVGPTPVLDGIERCEQIRREVGDHLESEALALRHLGGLHAMNGEFELARSLLATSNAVFDDLGPTLNAATSHNEAAVEMLAGNPAAAEASLRSGFEMLQQMGEQWVRSTTVAFLARAVFAQGRDDEAEELARQSAELSAPGDLLTQMLWRGVEARIVARRGRLDEAEALAREAVALAGRTDFLVHHGDALVDLASILEEAGRRHEAAAAAVEGLHLHERKGNVVTAGKIRSRFDVM